MSARTYHCETTDIQFLTPTVCEITFQASKPVRFEPGQFLSFYIPPLVPGGSPLRRVYSFSSSPHDCGRGRFQICVKIVPGGRGSNFLAALKKGDTIKFSAPYGDFVLSERRHRHVCFIATGTGIGPLKSMLLSREFAKNPPESRLLLFGARDESEILFEDLFSSHGFKIVNALTKPSSDWSGFSGRISDFLNLGQLTDLINVRDTDFFLCGNGQMIHTVSNQLRGLYFVSFRQIHKEAYFEPWGKAFNSVKTDFITIKALF